MVAKLHEMELELDRDADAAVRTLAVTTLTVADRYAEGRVSALMDAAELTKTEPVPARSRWVRPGLALAVLLLCVGGIATFEIPQAVEQFAIVGAGTLVSLLLYGPGEFLPPRRRRPR
ncbi:hypothetical protein [Streptomyces sp. NPDC093111]|uniref:hypothetical protein n=1 Tax=Streptomyces sp. NPDC093111 TaxID=3154978 RepID=UPI0034213A42